MTESDDKIHNQLVNKAIGFSTEEVRIHGLPAVVPGDLNYVLRSVSVTPAGVMKLSFAVQPQPGQPDTPHAQLAMKGCEGLHITHDAIEIRTARYLRWEETIAVHSGDGLRITSAEMDRGGAVKGAPALRLERSRT